MDFQESLNMLYPGAIPQNEFVSSTYERLSHAHGFNKDNSIACVSVCRDELTAPLLFEVSNVWGEAFNFSSLGGFLTLGKTGFMAAQHHAPIENGYERYIFFAFPHIAIGPNGEVGLCTREGREGTSSACGALSAFHKEISSGKLQLEMDALDLEQSFLKQRLFGKMSYGDKPDLVELTKLAYEAILEDLEKLISLTTRVTTSKYAVLTGIQIHNSTGVDYIWPGATYIGDGGRRLDIVI